MGGLFREEGPILPINVFNFCVTIIYTQFHVVRKRSSHTPCSVSHTLIEEFRTLVRQLLTRGLKKL